MKIDSVVFSCSEPEEYSSFWNIQSKIYSSMGIEPTCLLFGKKSNTNMNENYGRILEMEIISSIPYMLQLTMSKFFFPTKEPEKTWLIGDMDLIPLQKSHFIDKISQYDEDSYVHLNAAGIAAPRVGDLEGFLKYGPQKRGSSVRPLPEGVSVGCDLPAHYHVSKGFNFNIFLSGNEQEQISKIKNSHKYGLGPLHHQSQENSISDPTNYYWAAEENYTSEIIWNNIQNKTIKYIGITYNNSNNIERIDRSGWNNSINQYTYSEELLINKKIVDIHCTRPYEKQKESLERIIELSGILK